MALRSLSRGQLAGGWAFPILLAVATLVGTHAGRGLAKEQEPASATERPVFSLSQRLVVRGMAFSPDGRTLATTHTHGEGKRTRGEVVLWDLATGRPQTTFTTPSQMLQVEFTPDGRLLMLSVSGISDGEPSYQTQMWDTRTGRRTGTLPLAVFSTTPGLTRNVDVSPDLRWLAASIGGIQDPGDGDAAGGTSVFDVSGRRLVATFQVLPPFRAQSRQLDHLHARPLLRLLPWRTGVAPDGARPQQQSG